MLVQLINESTSSVSHNRKKLKDQILESIPKFQVTITASLLHDLLKKWFVVSLEKLPKAPECSNTTNILQAF